MHAIWSIKAADLIVHQQVANLPLYLPGNLGLSSRLGLHWMLGCQVKGTVQGATHPTAGSSPCRTHPVCCACVHSSWAHILTACTAAICTVWQLLQPSQAESACTVLTGVSCSGNPACSSGRASRLRTSSGCCSPATFLFVNLQESKGHYPRGLHVHQLKA